jgi:hypothetical protein
MIGNLANVTAVCALVLAHEHLALGVRIMDAYVWPRPLHPMASGTAKRQTMLNLLEDTATKVLIASPPVFSSKAPATPWRSEVLYDRSVLGGLRTRAQSSPPTSRKRRHLSPFDLGVEYDKLLQACGRSNYALATCTTFVKSRPSPTTKKQAKLNTTKMQRVQKVHIH